MAQQVIANAVERLPIARTCECARALATAIITQARRGSGRRRRTRLAPIVGSYLEVNP